MVVKRWGFIRLDINTINTVEVIHVLLLLITWFSKGRDFLDWV